jgi:hypothetical protein
MNRPTSFALHIRPLFRDQDISHMDFVFDLSAYADVRDNSQGILDRLRGQSGDLMPPADDGGPWPDEWITLFERWMNEGCPP